MLNFDIIIIIFMLFAIIYGIIRGLYRQIISILSIFIPTAIVMVSGSFISKQVRTFSITSKIMNWFYNVTKMVINLNYDDFVRWFINVMLFLVAFFICKSILNHYFLNTKKLLKITVTSKSRYIGGGLGLLNGFLIVMFTYILIMPMVVINDGQPLTKLFLLIYKPFQTFFG